MRVEEGKKKRMTREVEEDERREEYGQGQEKDERTAQTDWMAKWGDGGWGWMGMMHCGRANLARAQSFPATEVQAVLVLEVLCRQCAVRLVWRWAWRVRVR